MSETITAFVFQLNYLFTNLSLLNIIDILLVTVFFFVVFQALYQTRAMQLLRGTIIIAILGIALLFLLPLNTFTLLVQGLLIAGLIALPILFQDELRRALTGVGQLGRRREYSYGYDRVKKAILSTVSRLTQRYEGALIVLEGTTRLDDIISTGIPIQADEVTPELLNTIFYPKSSLHDGAVVLREDKLAAASCILPVLTEQTGDTHLGTRHLAALGLSNQAPDALVIVVSEETGGISIAENGRLHRSISKSELEEFLDKFRQQVEGHPQFRWGWLGAGGARVILTNLVVAAALALVAWVSVTYQTNPPQQVTITDVPLLVISPSPVLVLTSELPETVLVRAQTTQDRMNELNTFSIRTEVDLSALTAGVHRVPVEVELANQLDQFISVEPEYVNVTLEPFLTEEFPPNIVILDPGSVPLGYAYEGFSVSPESILVQGPESQVNQVAQAKSTVRINGRREDFQEVVSVILIDQEGNEVEDLIPSPEQVVVDVNIVQTFLTREAAIQAVLDTDSLDENYEITSIELSPSTVLLTGDPEALSEVGEYVETAPIDLTGVYNELNTEVPLILPGGVSALNEAGEMVLTTNARVVVEPVTVYLATTRLIEVRGLNPSLSAKLSEDWVSVLLFGPGDILNQIQREPNLVIVYADLTGFTGGTYTVALQYEAPQDVIAEIFPSETGVVISQAP